MSPYSLNCRPAQQMERVVPLYVGILVEQVEQWNTAAF